MKKECLSVASEHCYACNDVKAHKVAKDCLVVHECPTPDFAALVRPLLRPSCDSPIMMRFCTVSASGRSASRRRTAQGTVNTH